MKGLHHMHMRKRVSRDIEPFPARTFWKRVLDRVVLAAGVVGPITAMPQIIVIYSTQQAGSVSLLAWAIPGVLNVPWILYGLAHKETPIVVTYSLWLLANTSVAVGVLMYG